ncbi:MAG: flavodoxin family protein [Proteobacteria bacterium]|nr:MAG: flavodoxin family protein [Pseudomonadota bacterium]
MNDAKDVRRSTTDGKIDQLEFQKRYLERFEGSEFLGMQNEIQALCDIAWESYKKGRKAPNTQKAGAGYAHPDYELNVHWIKANADLRKAEEEYKTSETPRILIVNGSDRNPNTCPGEISKSSRLIEAAQKAIHAESKDTFVQIDVLNLNEMTAEFGKVIYPCKGCVSTAMPLCHYPCSCYPHHSLGQVNDWMNDIYPMFARAHGILFITPVYWRQAPSALKLLMDRMVCADGGNRDPTSTKGKTAELAKQLELDGWDYPRHLKGRIYSVVVHGDAEGIDDLKTALTNWLDAMNLVPAGTLPSLARYIGYMEPYATSHKALDKDKAIFKEVENVATALIRTVVDKRKGLLSAYQQELDDPRPK